jgi:hypothetical protein
MEFSKPYIYRGVDNFMKIVIFGVKLEAARSSVGFLPQLNMASQPRRP